MAIAIDAIFSVSVWTCTQEFQGDSCAIFSVSMWTCTQEF